MGLNIFIFIMIVFVISAIDDNNTQRRKEEFAPEHRTCWNCNAVKGDHDDPSQRCSRCLNGSNWK